MAEYKEEKKKVDRTGEKIYKDAASDARSLVTSTSSTRPTDILRAEKRAPQEITEDIGVEITKYDKPPGDPYKLPDDDGGPIPEIPPFTGTTEASETAYNAMVADRLARIDGRVIKITLLKVQNKNKFLDPNGESRKISVIGTIGARFSLAINDSSGYDILEQESHEVEIPKSGLYSTHVKFPRLIDKSTDTVKKETYDIVISPNAEVKVEGDVKIAIPTYTLKQFGQTTLTVDAVSTQTSPAVTITGDSLLKKGNAGTAGNNASFTYAITCTENPATAGYFYVKPTGGFDKNLISNSMIKRIVDRGNEVGSTRQLTLNPKTSRTRIVKGASVISNDIEVGMKVRYKVEKEKVVTKSIGVVDSQKPTDTFQLNNTIGLFPNMLLRGHGLPVVIVSVDCDREITVSKKIIIKENTEVTFKYEDGSTVTSIISKSNSEGKACVGILTAMDVPNKTELEFDDNDSSISGSFNFSGSGSDSVSISSFVNFNKYGTSSIDYSLNIDNIITRIPNAFEQYLTQEYGETSLVINMTKHDYDDNARFKSVVITNTPKHGTAVAANGGLDATWSASPKVTYTPVKGFKGQDEFKFTVGDGTNTSVEKTIRITVK